LSKSGGVAFIDVRVLGVSGDASTESTTAGIQIAIGEHDCGYPRCLLHGNQCGDRPAKTVADELALVERQMM